MKGVQKFTDASSLPSNNQDTLRHTYATRLEEAGIPPKVKQYLLGHASLEMTQNTYTDTQEQYIDSLLEKVRAVF